MLKFVLLVNWARLDISFNVSPDNSAKARSGDFVALSLQVTSNPCVISSNISSSPTTNRLETRQVSLDLVLLLISVVFSPPRLKILRRCL